MMKIEHYAQYNDTELATLLGLDEPIDRAEMIRLANADDVEDFAQALTAAMDSQIYVPGAQAVTDMYRAAIARADALAAEVGRLTAELQNTTVDRDMALRYADVLKNERDALRAQLDAAQFTFDTDPPVDAQIDAICHEVQMDARGTWWHGSNIIYPDGWRPAPPQE